MKKLISVLLILSTSALVSAQALPEVFSAIAVEIKENHSGPEFANKMRAVNKAMRQHGKGIGVWLSYGDRGERKNKLTWGFAFDFKEVRDYYFPKADAGEGAYPRFEALMAELNAVGIDMAQDAVEPEGGYTDYVCIGYDLFDNPKMGEVAAVRPLYVSKESEIAFEAFLIDELYPTFQRHLPGLDAYVYKGDRGENKGGYILIWSFDSVDTRNEYFPEEGEGAAEKFAKEFEMVSGVTDKISQFAPEDAPEATYTDYVRIDLGYK